ncbi:MAG TPA: hypothetical protein DCS11_08250 [Syntrophus sp. (in: bacteria)]|jgi:hypothetical protein|nr:hypothetical protein [Syntrophus sp. (in: bacteria)]
MKMTRTHRRAFTAWMLVAMAGLPAFGQVNRADPGPGPLAADQARPSGLPSVGKWMLDAQGRPANWLGKSYRGKALREPINIIVLDQSSRTADEARERLVRNCASAGYPVRKGHSGGYSGVIGGIAYGQIPGGDRVAFSNGPFEFDNNHGRFFGPHPFDGGWVFIGALSREKVEPLAKVKHGYASFTRARDDFARRLDGHTDYRIAGLVDLDNALDQDTAVTTGDHSGFAVLLTSEESRQPPPSAR